jgi:hypothetical protein
MALPRQGTSLLKVQPKVIKSHVLVSLKGHIDGWPG